MKLKLIILTTLAFTPAMHASSTSSTSSEEQQERDDLTFVCSKTVQEAEKELQEAIDIFMKHKNRSSITLKLFKNFLYLKLLLKQHDDEGDAVKKNEISKQIKNAHDQNAKDEGALLKTNPMDVVNHNKCMYNIHVFLSENWRAKYEDEHQANKALKEQLKQTKRDFEQLKILHRRPVSAQAQEKTSTFDMQKFSQLAQAKK